MIQQTIPSSKLWQKVLGITSGIVTKVYFRMHPLVDGQRVEHYKLPEQLQAYFPGSFPRRHVVPTITSVHLDAHYPFEMQLNANILGYSLADIVDNSTTRKQSMDHYLITRDNLLELIEMVSNGPLETEIIIKGISIPSSVMWKRQPLSADMIQFPYDTASQIYHAIKNSD